MGLFMDKVNNCEKKIFISYAHEDEDLRNELEKHLSILRIGNIISTWHDRKITAGSETNKEIDKHLYASQIILLLISSDFINSDYCYGNEMDKAMELHNNNEAIVIPIMLRSIADWELTPFGKLEVLPKGGKPIKLWNDLDEAFSNVVEGISEKIKLCVNKNNTGNEERIVSNISEKYNRNINFAGRENILDNITEILNSGKSTVITQAIIGLGGIGKTQLAIEYAYRSIGKYKVIWWINADTPALLANEYSNLAKKLGYIDNRLDQEALIKLTKEWLEQNNNWLLIFDNASEALYLSEYIPQISTGHVIITSRNTNWSEIAKEIPIEVFGEDEAVNFILNRTGQKDIEAARELAEKLGYLPLALEQAAAYMKSRGKSILQYMELFRMYKIRLFAKSDKPLSYNDTVATTWQISFENINNTFPASLDILNFLAFLYPTDIPLELIKKSVSFLSNEYKKLLLDPLELDEAIRILYKYSLISITNDTISIHRLVQSVIKGNLSEEDRKKWIDISFKTLNKEFVFDREISSEIYQVSKIFPHSQQVLNHLKEYNILSNDIIDFAIRIGLFLYEKALYSEALQCVEEVLKISRDIEDKEKIVDMENFIGQMNITLGDYKSGIEYFSKVLDMERIQDKPRNEMIAMTLSYIGVAYEELNELEKSLEFNKQAYDLSREYFSINTTVTVTTKFHLAKVMSKTGDFKIAKEYYESILNIDQIENILQRQEYATILADYSFLLGKFGEYERAIKMVEKALIIDREIYLKDHPNIARDLNNYAYLLCDINQLNKSEEMYKKALVIYRNVFKNKNAIIAITLSNYSSVLGRLGEFDEAKKLLQESLEINHLIYGEKHSEIAINYSNIGRLYLTGNDPTANDILEAKENLRRALKIDREIYGDAHAEIATDLIYLGEALMSENRFEAARKIGEKALSIDMKQDENNYINVARDFSFLSLVNFKDGKMENAQKLTAKVLSIYENLYDKANERVLKEQMEYAYICMCNNKKEEALKYYMKTAKQYEYFKDKYINELLICLYEICNILKEKKDYKNLEFYIYKIINHINISTNIQVSEEYMMINNMLGNFYLEKFEYRISLDYYKIALKVAKQVYRGEHLNINRIAEKIMTTMNRM